MYIMGCLILISILGISNLFVSPKIFGFYDGTRVLNYWYYSVTTFAIPLVLALLGLTKNKLIKIGQIIWSFWLTLLSLAVIASYNYNSNISKYGYIFVLMVLILSIAVILFSTIDFTKKNSKSMQFKSKA